MPTGLTLGQVTDEVFFTSLIEMQEIQKAKDCLNQVEKEKDLTEEQRNKIEILKGRMKEKEDG